MNSKKRISIVVLVILLLVASVTVVAAMIIPSAEDLLTQSLESLEDISDAHLVVNVTADLPADLFGQFAQVDLPDSLNGTFEVWGKIDAGPDGQPVPVGFRFEVLDAGEEKMIGLTAVSDGSQFWLYHPERNTVITGKHEDMAAILIEKMSEYEGGFEEFAGSEHFADFDPNMADHPETPDESVTKLLEYVTAERDGQDQLAAGDAYRLRLVPVAEKMPDQFALVGGYVNLWLRSSDHFPLAVEYAESALAYGRIEATTAEINTDFDNSIFTFEIPEGAEVITAEEFLAAMEMVDHKAAESDFKPLQASDFPEGAVAEEAQKVAGAHVQRYQLPDDSSFIVAQGAAMPLDPPAGATGPETVTVRGVDGTLFTNEEASRTLLAWSEGEIFFVIGGDLSPELALTIAESLE